MNLPIGTPVTAPVSLFPTFQSSEKSGQVSGSTLSDSSGSVGAGDTIGAGNEGNASTVNLQKLEQETLQLLLMLIESMQQSASQSDAASGDGDGSEALGNSAPAPGQASNGPGTPASSAVQGLNGWSSSPSINGVSGASSSANTLSSASSPQGASSSSDLPTAVPGLTTGKTDVESVPGLQQRKQTVYQAAIDKGLNKTQAAVVEATFMGESRTGTYAEAHPSMPNCYGAMNMNADELRAGGYKGDLNALNSDSSQSLYAQASAFSNLVKTRGTDTALAFHFGGPTGADKGLASNYADQASKALGVRQAAQYMLANPEYLQNDSRVAGT